MKGKLYALRRQLSSLYSLFLPLIFFAFFILSGSEAQAKTVIIGTGSGSVSVNGMSGLAPGDILAITPGNYTGGGFSNLNGITITNNGGLVSFSGSISFSSNVNTIFIGNGAAGITYGFKIHDVSQDAIYTYGNHTRCTWSNIEFINVGDQAFNCQNALISYDGVNDNTKEYYICKFLYLHLDHVGAFTANYKGFTTNVQDSCEYAYITVDNSLGYIQINSSGLYRGNFHHWILNSSLANGQNDVGEFVIYGNASFHHNIRQGHHWGWFVRFFHVSLGPPVDIHIYNNVDIGSSSYGFTEWRVNNGYTGGNIYVYNNTSGNRKNSTNYTTAILLSYNSVAGYQAFAANNLEFNNVPGNPNANKTGVVNFGNTPLTSSNFLYYDNPIASGVLQDTTNCYLKAGSPAINAGANVSWITDDLGGVSRPQGPTFDVGAREFDFGAPPPPNQNPIANAGKKQNIYLPISTATLDGSKSYDPDGSITNYAWTQVSGPGTATITNAAAASTAVNGLVQGTYIFKLTVTDNQGATGTANDTVIVNPPNKPPVANAGGNQTIQLPVNSVSLNGSNSIDSDGTIAAYQWSQVSGPSGSTIVSSNAATTSINGLAQGTYIFKLQVTDNGGATGSAYDTITVLAANKPPVAVAGPKQTITLPVNSLTLNGSSSFDPDGTITSYSWTQISGPGGPAISNPASATTTVTFTTKGNYVFKLTVTDNQGATGTANDTIVVRPSASLPVADAGFDQSITLPTSTANLDGSGSYDSSGTITTYQWSQVSGPTTATLGSSNAAKATASGLQQGVYTFQLIVTDNNLYSDTDRINITVNPAPNQPPVANAGADQTITLPTSSASLDGTKSADPDGTIASYSWTKISGPGTQTISNGTTATPVISGLQAGQYVFQLAVTDNTGASSIDQVTITVNPAANQPPVANAGADQTIQLPANSVNLDGTKSY
ncbi:MAG: PKD domain-containing protein, partial [Chitinophagales bacterium]